jgi:hypothetical protein
MLTSGRATREFLSSLIEREDGELAPGSKATALYLPCQMSFH